MTARARSFGLAPLNIKVLLIGSDPRDIDLRFKQLYGYLNDDVTPPARVGQFRVRPVRGTGSVGSCDRGSGRTHRWSPVD